MYTKGNHTSTGVTGFFELNPYVECGTLAGLTFVNSMLFFSFATYARGDSAFSNIVVAAGICQLVLSISFLTKRPVIYAPLFVASILIPEVWGNYAAIYRHTIPFTNLLLVLATWLIAIELIIYIIGHFLARQLPLSPLRLYSKRAINFTLFVPQFFILLSMVNVALKR